MQPPTKEPRRVPSNARHHSLKPSPEGLLYFIGFGQIAFRNSKRSSCSRALLTNSWKLNGGSPNEGRWNTAVRTEEPKPLAKPGKVARAPTSLGKGAAQGEAPTRALTRHPLRAPPLAQKDRTIQQGGTCQTARHPRQGTGAKRQSQAAGTR